MPGTRTLTINGKELWVEILDGVVVGQRKWSDTQVWSSGGTRYVGPNGGYVCRPTVHSSSNLNHEFWVREPDGTETSISIVNRDFPIREGQHVRLAWAGPAGAKRGDYLFASNLTAKNTIDIKHDWQRWFKRTGILTTPKGYRATIFFLAAVLAAILVGVVIPLHMQNLLEPWMAGMGMRDAKAPSFLSLVKEVFYNQWAKEGVIHPSDVIGMWALAFLPSWVTIYIVGSGFFLSPWRTRESSKGREALFQEFLKPGR